MLPVMRLTSTADTDPAARCSARGCRAAATTDLSWRNPRLHDPQRVKHWLVLRPARRRVGGLSATAGIPAKPRRDWMILNLGG